MNKKDTVLIKFALNNSTEGIKILRFDSLQCFFKEFPNYAWYEILKD